jgi:pyruvate kinase
VPNTKIVATLGPATDSPAVLGEMMSSGVSIFRLNTSHGTQSEHAARISAVRAMAAEQGTYVACCSICKARKSAWAGARAKAV